MFTPKSLLRHKKAVSALEEMSSGTSFHRVLGTTRSSKPASPRSH
ncbi:MAG: hypothetical protein WDM79_00055 [Terricaulis sp.]